MTPSLGSLITKHMLEGKRPIGDARQGRAWGSKELADVVGVQDRTVRNWKNNESPITDLEAVERAFFGNDQSKSRFARLRLRSANEFKETGQYPDHLNPDDALGVSFVPATKLEIKNFEYFNFPDDVAAAREFLRGGKGRFDIAAHVAVPRPESDQVVSGVVSGSLITMLVGAVGEGASTALMQAASELISFSEDLPVYWCFDGNLPHESPCGGASHILLVDEGHQIKELPDWFAEFYANPLNGSRLVLSCRNKDERRIRNLFGQPIHRIEVQAPDHHQSSEFVKAIIDFDASDAPTEDVGDLFQSGLEAIGALRASLFAAMFQATRGVKLEDRFRELVGTKLDVDPELDALALIAFGNFLYDLQPEVGLSSTSFLGSVAQFATHGEVVNRCDAIKSALSNLVDNWSGEILKLAGHSMCIRHPTVTHVLFRSIFGGDPRRFGPAAKDIRRSKWHYFECFLKQALLLKGAVGAPNATWVSQLMKESFRYDTWNPKSERLHEPFDHVVDLIDRAFTHEVSEHPEGSEERHRSSSRLAFVLATAASRQIEGEKKENLKSRILEIIEYLTSEPNIKPALIGEVAGTLEVLSRDEKFLIAGEQVHWTDLFHTGILAAEIEDDDYNIRRGREALVRTILERPKDSSSSQPDWYPSPSDLSELCLRADVIGNARFDDTRLVLLLRLFSVSGEAYQGFSPLPNGCAQDNQLTTRTGILNQIWAELERLQGIGMLERALMRVEISSLLDFAVVEWLALRDADATLTTQSEFDAALSKRDWISAALLRSGSREPTS